MRPDDACAESGLLTVDQARARLLAAVRCLPEIERVPLKRARARILAEDLVSPLDLPPFANASMDGYAFRAEDLPAHPRLRLAGASKAGHPFGGALEPGRCVRIFTGAPLPKGADTVVPQEDVVAEGDWIRLTVPARPHEFIRPQGDELRRGDIVLRAGKRLNAADLGLLASAGYPEVAVRRPLRVAFFSTGDELRPVGHGLRFGEIHESNRYILAGLLDEAGIEALDFGNLRDDPDAIRQAVAEAAAVADAVITTGGASVGEADFIVRTLRELGEVDFWKVALKPGKPFVFGRVGGAFLFGLPGNPVAVMVTFGLLVRPALDALMGTVPGEPVRLPAVCENRLRKRPGRLEFQRGLCRRAADGYRVMGLRGQGSHQLAPMSAANCFIVLPLENAGVEPGQTVEIELFSGTL
jgi:molybdopterin molybdotransferase